MKTLYIPVTTAADGTAAVTSTKHVTGKLLAVQCVDGTYDDGVDLTMSCENGNLSYNIIVKANFNTDQMIYPRTLEHLDTDGSALTTHCQHVLNGKIKVTLAQGGNAKSGGFNVYYE